MEYIPGRTAAQLLEGVEDPAGKEAIYRQVAFGLHELHRIPVPPRSRPAAVDGGMIRHSLFDEQQAPQHYQIVDQLEQHLNLFLQVTKRKSMVQELSREPMVFCYSDLWLGNFIIDQDERVTVVDFADASILPSSFSKFVFSPTQNDLEYDITNWVNVPSTDGVDNSEALRAAAGPMVLGPSTFVSTGRRGLGRELKNEDGIMELAYLSDSLAISCEGLDSRLLLSGDGHSQRNQPTGDSPTESI